MEELIRNIEIEDFINIRILELNNSNYVYFVEDYNEKYFYTNNNNELCTHHPISIRRKLYFQKAKIIYRDNLITLEKEIYKLYGQLTFKIDRVNKEEKYYIITRNFKVTSAIETNDITDDNQYKEYNYFKNEEEAKKCAKILQETLVKLRKEEYIKGE